MKPIMAPFAIAAACLMACQDAGLSPNTFRPLASLGSQAGQGSKIVFTTDRDGPDPAGNLGNQEIYLMNADGTDQRRLTDNAAIDGAPVWAPNGRRIAFHSTRANPGPPPRAIDIFLMKRTSPLSASAPWTPPGLLTGGGSPSAAKRRRGRSSSSTRMARA